jgi:nucleotide-binding universal stress UspA family protein
VSQVQCFPTWEGIVDAVQEHGATLIVLGSHHRSGLLGQLSGSVAATTVAHFGAVLVVHRPE